MSLGQPFPRTGLPACPSGPSTHSSTLHTVYFCIPLVVIVHLCVDILSLNAWSHETYGMIGEIAFCVLQ